MGGQDYLERMNLESVATCPFVYKELSSRRLLTLEKFDGVPLTDLEAIKQVRRNALWGEATAFPFSLKREPLARKTASKTLSSWPHNASSAPWASTPSPQHYQLGIGASGQQNRSSVVWVHRVA